MTVAAINKNARIEFLFTLKHLSFFMAERQVAGSGRFVFRIQMRNGRLPFPTSRIIFQYLLRDGDYRSLHGRITGSNPPFENGLHRKILHIIFITAICKGSSLIAS